MTSVLVLFGLICLAWLAYVARPLVAGRVVASRGDLRRQLEEEKRGLLVALRDAENDHGLGKLDVADYRKIREALEIRAARVMKELESVGEGSANTLDGALERIRALRAGEAPASAPPAPGASTDGVGDASPGVAPATTADPGAGEAPEEARDRAREAPGG